MRKGKGSAALATVKRFFGGVKSVADATKELVIEVTPVDSANSVALDHARCALAVACKRSQKADGVIIGTKTAYVIHGHKALRYRMLESVAREIVSFDRKAGFAPGLYRLKAPGEYEQLGKQVGKSENPSGRKRNPLRHVTANIRSMLGHAPGQEGTA